MEGRAFPCDHHGMCISSHLLSSLFISAVENLNRTFTILFLWVPLIAYIALIFFLSSLSRIRVASYVPDYFLHSVEYFVLSILVIRAFNSGLKRKVTGKALVWGAVFSIVYAVSDELHQFFVPERSASAVDLISDAAGVLLGMACIFLAQKLYNVPLKIAENPSKPD